VIYSDKDLAAYGSNRWRRIRALAAEFERYWKEYIYGIGTKREQWVNIQKNASVGDIVLMREKNSPRLEWPTGTITEVITADDGLVRRVVVQPHARKGKPTTEAPRERAIHDLILLSSLTERDQPTTVDTSGLNQKEAEQVLKTTECWENTLRQDQEETRRQTLFELEVEELQKSAADILDMIYRINSDRAGQQHHEDGQQEPEKAEVPANQVPPPVLSHGDQNDKQRNGTKERHQYICTAPHLVEALEWTESYFQNRGASSRRTDITPEKSPPSKEPGVGIQNGFQEQRKWTREPEQELETQPPSRKPILSNKTAVQTEEIWRTVDIHTVLTEADERESTIGS